MKTKLSLIVAIMALSAFFCTSCQNFDEQKTTGYVSPYVKHVYTAEELFPEGDPLPFLIIPTDGWVVGPEDDIFFTALLLDEETGIYKDVTNSDKCIWDSSYGSGKMVHGGRPGRHNGETITVRCMWNKKLPGSSTGTFIIPDEYEGNYNQWE